MTFPLKLVQLTPSLPTASTYLGTVRPHALLAATTTTFAAVPESIAFALMAGLPPPVALHATWIVGGLLALAGPGAGLVGGATASLAAVVGDQVSAGHASLIPLVVILGGALQALGTLLAVNRLIRILPLTCLVGFTNGLALLIARAQTHALQLSPFLYPKAGAHVYFWDATPADLEGGPPLHVPQLLGIMAGQVLLTVAIVKVWPRISRSFPATLVAILVGSLVEQAVRAATGEGSITLAEASPVEGGIPGLPDGPAWTASDVWTSLPGAVSYATVALVEELLTMRVVDEVLERHTEPSTIRRQLGVGAIASMVAGAAGTMGGSTNVALSMVLLHSGDPGTSRVGPLLTAGLVALATFVAGPAIGYVPVGTLVGIMVVVIGHTFNWSSPLIVLAAVLPQGARNALHLHRKVRRTDAFVIAAVTVLTLVANLAIAVATGMVISAVLFAWQSSLRLSVESDVIRTHPRRSTEPVRRVKVYHVSGPLYYGTVGRLTEHFTFTKDPDDVEVHFREAQVHDFSGLQALMVIGERYHALGKRCTLRHLSVDATQLIARTRHWSLQPAAYDIHEHLEEGEVPLERAFHLTISENYDDPL